MHRHPGRALIGALFLSLLACSLPFSAGPTPTAPSPTETRSAPTATAPPATLTPTPTAAEDAAPQEAIFLRMPGPGSEVVSPLRVEGAADPTFEQNLGLRLLDFERSVIAEGSLIIDAPLGERGPFAGELAFSVTERQPAALQVFATSARDGGVTHMTGQVLALLPSGASQITTVEPGPERIQIRAPDSGATVSGGRVTVHGFGLASFEQTLVAEVHDATGAVVGSAPITVQAPGMGRPGPFEVQVPYSVSSAGPGRIVVFDPSPAFGGIVHLSSVEVELQP